MSPRSPRSRRDVLAAGATVAIGLAGCAGDRSAVRSPTGSSTTDGSPATPGTRTPPDSTRCSTTGEPVVALDESELVEASAVEAAPGDCPIIEDPRARFFCTLEGAPDDCLADATDVRIVSSGAVDGDAPVVMEPGTAEFELPGTLGLSITNGTDAPFSTNFHAWRLWKRGGDRWYHVAPSGNVQPAMALGPGERLRYCLTMDDSSYADEHLHPVHPDEHDRGRREPWSYAVPALGGGEYAFALFGAFAGDDEHGRRTGFVARFALLGDPIELTTSGHVEDVAVEGDRLTARWTYHDEGWASSRGRFALRRVADAPEPRPIITEQAMRLFPDSPIRDSIALARSHDVEEVVLEGLADGVPSFRSPEYPLEYDGDVYAIETETIEELA